MEGSQVERLADTPSPNRPKQGPTVAPSTHSSPSTAESEPSTPSPDGDLPAGNSANETAPPGEPQLDQEQANDPEAGSDQTTGPSASRLSPPLEGEGGGQGRSGSQGCLGRPAPPGRTSKEGGDPAMADPQAGPSELWTLDSGGWGRNGGGPESDGVDYDDWDAGPSSDPGGSQRQQKHSLEILRQGNSCYRRNKFEEAIELYSNALRGTLTDRQQAVFLSNRCGAYCSLSKSLRHTPAAMSERRALVGLDPLYLAQLAMKDSQRLVQLVPTLPKAYYRKAVAHQLLEQYDSAREAFMSGLHIDPVSKLLQDGLRDLDEEEQKAGRIPGQASPTSPKRKRKPPERTEDFDCVLCMKLLISPVTTPCGHTFCRHCLRQSMDHGNKCPMCRGLLVLDPVGFPVSITLQSIIEKNFPEEAEERKAEVAGIVIENMEILPLFVMDVIIPEQKILLNIFEPRYRLMIRRAMGGDRRFGMVGSDPQTREVYTVAVEVLITDCQPMHDGRYHIQVEARRRFKIVNCWEQDGYRVGQVEWLQDEVPPVGSPEEEQLRSLAADTAQLAERFKRSVTELGGGARLGFRWRNMIEIINQAGNVPPVTEPERLSFWLLMLLPLSVLEKMELMLSQDTSERLRRAMAYLQEDRINNCRVH